MKRQNTLIAHLEQSLRDAEQKSSSSEVVQNLQQKNDELDSQIAKFVSFFESANFVFDRANRAPKMPGLRTKSDIALILWGSAAKGMTFWVYCAQIALCKPKSCSLSRSLHKHMKFNFCFTVYVRLAIFSVQRVQSA